MDFLNTALFVHSDTSSDLVCDGALVTTFNNEVLTDRAVVRYVTPSDIKNYEGKLNPVGFCMGNDGILYSETQCQKGLTSDVVGYLSAEYTKGVKPPLGLLDVILYGAEAGMKLIVNPTEWRNGQDAITVSFHKFKVSNSSFNIYTPYQKSDGRFRTFSLVDVVTEDTYVLTVMLPSECLDKVAPIKEFLFPSIDTPSVEGWEVFTVKAPLNGVSIFGGESFCNYLANQVAYYSIGLKVFNDFLVSTNYITQEPEKYEITHDVKKPRRNVSITCNYKHAWTEEILSVLDKREILQGMLDSSIEARMTMSWIQTIVSNKVNVCANTEEELIPASCINLRPVCQKNLLHCAIELLAQRLFIINAGPFGDPLGFDLKGGGVDGCSTKRVTW